MELESTYGELIERTDGFTCKTNFLLEKVIDDCLTSVCRKQIPITPNHNYSSEKMTLPHHEYMI